MHDVIKNYTEVINAIEHRLKDQNINQPKVIAVSKTFSLDKILPLIDCGHLDYGENKVQEAIEKWSDIKLTKKELKLHLIGKLQTNTRVWPSRRRRGLQSFVWRRVNLAC